jgi:SAM-dependent methyltransferase
MSARVTGSFRDPSGYVFAHEGRIFRAIDTRCHGVLREFAGTGLLEKFIGARQLVATHFVEDAALSAQLGAAHPGMENFLEHERLEHLTFPYEWTVSMLADAALLTLELQIELAGQGFALKDATAYNIQFRDGSPVFIDLSSIERPQRLDVWFALGQFQRHFLFPLLLAVRRGWDLRSYFLGNLDGLGPAQVLANFRGLSKWSPGVFLDLTLPAMLENKASAARGKTWEASKQKPAGDAGAQLLNLKRLRRKVAGLAAGYRTGGAWHNYTATCTYDDAAEASKRKLIAAFLGEKKPRTVLDFGCNTGDYSYLAAEHGCTVIAADADHDAAELLHRRLREKPAKITAMVVNAANPSPAIGYMNSERPSFLDRMTSGPDCVFALALIHHLLVSANLTLALIRDLFAALTARWLILEFVPTDDVQFQRLLQFRENLFDGITLAACLEVFGERFTLHAQQPVAGTGRTLLFLEKRP